MITAKYSLYNPISIREFTASKQTGFFDSLKQSRFSGQLVLTGSKGEKWAFYLYLGRIMYSTGGLHPVRRWRRNVALYFPQLASDSAAMQVDIESLGVHNTQVCWEYQLLCLWVEQQKLRANKPPV